MTARKPPPGPRKCRECGHVFQPANRNTWLCSEKCRRRRNLKRDARRNRRQRREQATYYVAPEPPSGRRTESHVDCRNYNVCLSIAAKAQRASVPCVGCSQHQPQDIRVDGPIASLNRPAMGIDGCGEGNRRRGVR